MKIAVTGGAGYIGSTLIKKLYENGESVVSIDNLIQGDYRHISNLERDQRIELWKGDIRNGESLNTLFKDSDSIAHLAALPGLIKCRENPEEAVSINIYGTHQVLETARKLDIKKVVFCSSAAVYGVPIKLPVYEDHPLKPVNLYGVSKLAGEKMMQVYFENYDIETISLRFGNVYGVGLYTNYETVIPKFIKLGLRGKPLTVFGDGKSSRDFVHVEDIVQALVLSLKSNKKGKVYNVGGETLEIFDLASLVIKEIEKLVEKKTGIIYLPPRPGETKEFSYNTDKITTELGYLPKWSVNEGIKQIIKYSLTNLSNLK